MNSRATYTHEFVELIPEEAELEEGILYVSTEFQTAAHRCMCGCGSKIITPLAASAAPNRWLMTFERETVSLAPSVGNWSYPCQSHYWLHGGCVEWSRRWTPEEIIAARAEEAVRHERLAGAAAPHTRNRAVELIARLLRALRGTRR